MKAITVRIIESIAGLKPQEQIEFLSLTCGEETKNIIAYNKGNGYIKLFQYQEFFNYYAYDTDAVSMDISFDLYNTDEDFERFVAKRFFQDAPKRERLIFLAHESGISVLDSERAKEQVIVAHINKDGAIYFYSQLTNKARQGGRLRDTPALQQRKII